MSHAYALLTAAATALLLVTACASVPRLIERDRLDRAYELSLKRAERRLARGKALRPAQLIEYLRAFDTIQTRDLETAWALERRPGAAKYDPLFRRYDALYARSEELLSVAPAEARFDIVPELYPAELERLRERARHRAATHYDSLGAPLRRAARVGDKPAARRAYALYDSVAFFSPERAGHLRPTPDSLYDVGTLRIHVYAVGDEGHDVIQRRLQRYTKPERRGWTEVTAWPTGQRVDLEAELSFAEANYSGVSERCSDRDYSKEIVDYIEKKRVKVEVNDSTTVEKIVEVKHYKTIRATVVTCDQSASARATGEVRVYAAGEDRVLWREELSASCSWSDTYKYTEGDERAVPGSAPSQRPGTAPSRGSMVADAQAGLGRVGWRAVMGRYGE